MGVILAGTNVYVDVALEEKGEHNNDITEYAIEDGSKIHSHAHLLPRIVTVEGLVVGSGYRGKVEFLKQLRDDRTIVGYVGRMYYGSMVIKELLETYDSGIKNGARIRIVFQQVKIVGGAYAPASGFGNVAPDPAGKWWQ